MFLTMRIGDAWKPVQRGLVLTTTTALELQDFYLNTKKFGFVLLSRLSQDALENLFSMIRGKNPVPTPKEFKSALRMISAAQYFKPNKNGNYEAEDADFLFEYLKTRQSSSTKIDLPDFTYGSSLCDENVSPNQFIESKIFCN
ncbi:Uncharacterized protein DBV15_12800 [Temnothorax longispinosus]|uniref:Transposable element P transposase-like RNase H C-terminal domain-containing protein n=1 Tax=Temnothorax longispinosus TaxID=300112 RepID=A0A4S2K9W6_9HYME|nr:Uncharacterized protein DBV15_12800 [Temnothorax longispinosus]